MHRIHTEIFTKMPYTEFDRAVFKVVEQRKEMMKSRNRNGQLLYKEEERDITLYKTPIEMLIKLP